MRDVLPLLTAGVGICFLGLELVTTGLQESTSRTLRAVIRRSTKSLPWCAALGVFAGALMQSTTSVTTVMGSMAATGMVALRQALPIVAFANVGTTVLVFAGALDIRVAVLFAVGVAGIAFSLTTEFRWKAVVSIALGVALLLHGSSLVTAAASDVEHASWFEHFLRSWSYGAIATAFGVGTLASFVTYSTATVALIAVAVANAGLVELSDAVAMIYGANVGSTLMRMLLFRGTTGTLRQVSRFQDLFKIAGTVMFVSLLIVEQGFHVPLVEALATRLIDSLPLQLATINLIFNGSIAILAVIFGGPIERFVARTWPPSAVEDLSTPKYATHDGLGDAATAIDLLEKEQMRVIKSTRDYLALLRPHAAALAFNPASLHRSFAVLFGEIEHFYASLVGKHVDETTSERLGNVHGRQELLVLVEESLFQLSSSAESIARDAKLAPLVENFAEALDFLLMFAGDAARTLDRDRAQFVYDLSSDRGEMMGGIRTLYLAPDQALTADEKTSLLRLTNLFERVVWMLQRYAGLLLKNVDAIG